MVLVATFNWTTGPVSSSFGQDNIRIVILNNSSVTRSVTVRLYDLTVTPKRRVLSDGITLRPYGSAFIDVPETLNYWEMQYSASSRSVRAFVAARQGNVNLPGNTILNSHFIRY